MKIISDDSNMIEIQGQASEFAVLSRQIKNSRIKLKQEVLLSSSPQSKIILECNNKPVSIQSNSETININYPESAKNKLYSLLSMPSDTQPCTSFFIRPCDHAEMFSADSKGLVLNVI